LRVVCATGEVMAIFCPTSWFISVDFPTLGRPMMPIKPDLKPSGAWGILDQSEMSSWSMLEAKSILSPSSMLCATLQYICFLQSTAVACLVTEKFCPYPQTAKATTFDCEAQCFVSPSLGQVISFDRDLHLR